VDETPGSTAFPLLLQRLQLAMSFFRMAKCRPIVARRRVVLHCSVPIIFEAAHERKLGGAEGFRFRASDRRAGRGRPPAAYVQNQKNFAARINIPQHSRIALLV
jgi:hypothetical protein